MTKISKYLIFEHMELIGSIIRNSNRIYKPILESPSTKKKLILTRVITQTPTGSWRWPFHEPKTGPEFLDFFWVMAKYSNLRTIHSIKSVRYFIIEVQTPFISSKYAFSRIVKYSKTQTYIHHMLPQKVAKN